MTSLGRDSNLVVIAGDKSTTQLPVASKILKCIWFKPLVLTYS